MLRKLAPALVAPLLLVIACASQGVEGAVEVKTGAVAMEALESAPDAAAEAGTAAFEMVISTTDDDQAFEFVATGVFDSDEQQMAMEMDLGGMFAGLAESTGETLPADFDEPFRFVVDGTTVYLRFPMLDALTDSSDWLSATAEDLGQSADSLGIGNSGYDPSKLLEVLRGVTDDVEAAGEDEVRGVPTTRYTATVSLVEALEQAPPDQREPLEAQLDQLGAGDADIPVEVWVDADGLPRRMIMGFDGLLATAGVGAGASVEISMELFDYGDPVEIEVPSPDEVTPYTEVLGALGGAFGAAGS